MNTIHLHGPLGQEFGEKFELEVSSIREALRALFTITDGLAAKVKEQGWRLVRGDKDSGAVLTEEMFDISLGEADLHLIPAVEGAGGGGAGKIIIGVIMIAAAFFTAGASLAAMTAFQTGVAVMGGAMIVSGITTMMAQTPPTDVTARAEENQESFLFDGPVNVNAQGGPVYLVYGEVETGSVVISSGISVEDLEVGEDTRDIESEIKGAWNG